MTAIESPTNALHGTQAIATSYYGLGGDESLIQSVQFKWDAVLVATITIWTSNFPEVALDSIVAGDWIQQIPPTGYTAISPVGSATAATPFVLTIPGGTAGGADMQIGNLGSRLLRARVIATTAGVLRIRTNGKD